MSADLYAVWGNPIAHSLSPRMQTLFAQQSLQNMCYEARLGDMENFETQLREFFTTAHGCNVTAPFKQRAFQLADEVSKRCNLAQSCNTLLKLNSGKLYGDNTDGVGLVRDLERLDWLNSHQNILILGAGGATMGIVYDLLQAGQKLYIHNRTLAKAESLVKPFQAYGEIRVFQPFELVENFPVFDLIINATSFSRKDKLVLEVQNFLTQQCQTNPNLKIYDLQYRLYELTPFLNLVQSMGVTQISDGLGMLVAQGAESFKLWREERAGQKIKLDYWQVLAKLRA